MHGHSIPRRDAINGRFLPVSVDDRLWNKIDVADCWQWIGRVDPKGYGTFTLSQVPKMAHRVVYEMLVGAIPASMTLDHLCRNHGCVNPDHLEVVTRGENVLRGATITARNLAKTQCPVGHPYDTANTSMYRGRRSCKTCHRLRERIRRNAQR